LGLLLFHLLLANPIFQRRPSQVILIRTFLRVLLVVRLASAELVASELAVHTSLVQADVRVRRFTPELVLPELTKHTRLLHPEISVRPLSAELILSELTQHPGTL